MKDERLTLLPGCALRWLWIDATGEYRPCVLQLERLHIVEPKVVSAASPRSCTEQANARDAAYWRRKVEKHTPVQYEELVHDLFSKELEKEVDLLDFRIFHNKQYLGKSGHQHQIDVSAEFKIAGVKILIVIECKQYTRSVGIDDVMVLTSRLDDIGAHKGILVTTMGFQAGAVKMARSRGIALVKACDLGWCPCFEDPAAEMRRQQEFSRILETFLRWYLGSKAKREEVDCAVKRIATFDVVSAFGVKPYSLGSLQYGQGPIQLPPSIRDVSAQHAFVVEGECSQIILDTRGLFALLALDEVG